MTLLVILTNSSTVAIQTPNVMPISGRAGAVPTVEPQKAYPPARSTALAGYPAAAMGTATNGFALAGGVKIGRNDSGLKNGHASAARMSGVKPITPA